LYWDVDVTSEDADEMIMKIASKIHEYKMDVAAILMIESIKPVSYLGSQMGRFFVSPFLPAFGETIGMGGEKLFQIFEKRENVEKLIKAVEELTREDNERKKVEKAEILRKKKSKIETGGASKKKGWRRFLP